jgi:hypothetical protein
MMARNSDEGEQRQGKDGLIMSGQQTVKDNMKRGRYDELKGILEERRREL